GGCGARSVARQRIGDDLTQAREEVGAHARVEALAVEAAQRQQAERPLIGQRHQGHRTDAGGIVAAEQELAQRIADLAAARLAGGEQRIKAGEAGFVGGHLAHETQADVLRAGGGAEQQQHRRRDIEVLAHALVDLREDGAPRGRAHQPPRETVHPLGQLLIGARDGDQLGEARVGALVLLAQHLDLPLDQRYRTAGGVGHAQGGQQLAVALEEIRMRAQPAGDVLIGQRGFVADGGSGHGWDVFPCGRSNRPVKDTSAGPSSQRRVPGPSQRTMSLPPGSVTVTRASSRPATMPVATAAQAPVPQARVSPTPRSNTRNAIWPRSMTWRKPTFTRRVKRGWRSSTAPSSPTGAVATSGTSSTACGLPIEAMANSTRPVGRSML